MLWCPRELIVDLDKESVCDEDKGSKVDGIFHSKDVMHLCAQFLCVLHAQTPHCGMGGGRACVSLAQERHQCVVSRTMSIPTGLPSPSLGMD